MSKKQPPPAPMTHRVAYFSELQPIAKGYLDTAIPGHARTVFNVIGKGVTEDPSYAAAIPEAEDFNMTYIKAEPGNGGALHSHTTVEVFIPFTGQWAIFWGDNGEHEVHLGPLDVVSVPAGTIRAFRNIGDTTAYMIAIQGGTDPGRVIWPQSVIEEARRRGLAHDIDGDLSTSGET